MNSVQVDDVLEIPAHQHINAGHGSDGDMLGIGAHPGRDHPLANVGFCKLPRFRVELESLDVCLRHQCQMLAHRGRGRSRALP